MGVLHRKERTYLWIQTRAPVWRKPANAALLTGNRNERRIKNLAFIKSRFLYKYQGKCNCTYNFYMIY